MDQQNKTTARPTIWAIIPAAGVGRRMAISQPKQYLQLEGKTILEHSLDKLSSCEAVAGVAVGIADNDAYWHKLEISHENLLGTYVGGAQRIHTVLKGLEYISKWAAKDDWVMVHDAVRPCVEVADIDLLIERAMQLKCSAILATPVIDTVKKLNQNGVIETTLNREELMLAATPQLFPIALLQRALELALAQNILSTDESAAVEMLGELPLAIATRRSNIKITTAEDLQIAGIFLAKNKDG